MNSFLKTSIVLVALYVFKACNPQGTKSDPVAILEDTIEVNIYPDKDIVIPTHTEFTRTHYPARIAEFKENPLKPGEIVFLGNSITEQGGDWAKRLGNNKVRNRGISGDTTDGVLERLGEIIFFKPKQVFILIGINDLFIEDRSAEIVHSHIIDIVNQIHQGSPDTEIYVQSVLPTNTDSIKVKIQNTNQMLNDSEAKNPYQFIDIHDRFATNEDAMDMNLSVDGVHLNENGYELWVNAIKDLVQ